MHRLRYSWMAAAVAAIVVLLSCASFSHGWSLGRSTSTSRRLPLFPRRYRHLDQDEERGRFNPKLRRIWKREIATNVPLPVVDPTEEDEAPTTTSVASSKKPTTVSPTTTPRPIHNVQELRMAVLDDGLELQQTELAAEEADIDAKELLNHAVIQLIAERFRTRSTPGNRFDNATLALSLEGGGMRGAVSAGMAAAIASLGLCDAFDSIYGSSAGSVVGAYMVSRQMCVDVYTDVLPAAQKTFVCKKRMMAGIVANAVDLVVGAPNNKWKASPGMNISFVLDGIMDHEHGLRPLDIKSFQGNDMVQPLRIATSCVKDGKLVSKCLGTNDFFPHIDAATNKTVSATVRQDAHREGIYACLEAGMTVPGATGPPVMLTDGNNVTTACFDAFCFEPLPYRSAVEEGATHVLVLRSRPEGFLAKTKPGVYERGVAPIYFKSHGQEDVAKFFSQGGQQYIYLEDLLTLEEGRLAGVRNDNKDGIHVPPTKILYGVDIDEKVKQTAASRDTWRKAHLLPLIVPKGTPELATLEQDQDEVLAAVRGGFAAAFDTLAPAIGLDLDAGMTGARVAQLVFPKQADQSLEGILAEQVSVRGHSIQHTLEEPKELGRPKRKRRALIAFGRRMSQPFRKQNEAIIPPDMFQEDDPRPLERCHRQDATDLLKLLPGIQNGNLPPLSDGLHYCRAESTLFC